MKRLIIALCFVFAVVSPAHGESITPQEYAQRYGATVVHDGDSPGWDSCVYNESDDWLVIMFSNGPYA